MNGALLRAMRERRLALSLAVFFAAGCGYDLEGTRRPRNLKGARTISIASFLNQTGEPGLERTITEAVRSGFLRDGRLRVSDSPDADVALEGVLREYRLAPIGFTQADQAQRYRVFVRTRVRLRDNARGKVLINQDLESDAEFAVSSSIARSDASRLSANQRVADSFSEDVVSLILEGF